MEPPSEIRPQETPDDPASILAPTPAGSLPPQRASRGIVWIFIGDQGLRAGWAILLFVVLMVLLVGALQFAAVTVYPALAHRSDSPAAAAIGGLFPALGTVLAIFILSRIERRRFLDYNLAGPRPLAHFIAGLGIGFCALSLLLGAMALGGWLHFSAMTLTALQTVQYGCIWAVAFCFTGIFEEGSFRCFLQFTLTRGINFWWALGTISLVCLGLLLNPHVNGANGVFCAAALGLVPCWLLHRGKVEGGSFWQAAWVTSTLFGSVHTGNHGESAIGIFAAAFIGFAFCVSIRVTGSAWWAIGCHSAWDWAETFFYGTADSGFVARGHFLSVTTSGNALWSGGADGPEGSLLVIPLTCLLIVFLLVVYRRNPPRPQIESAANRLAD